MLGVILHTLRHALARRVREGWRAAARRERRLRVGVDIRPFYEPLTGIGWYLYFLLHEFAKHDDVDLYLFGDARVTDVGPQLHADLPPRAELCAFDLRGRPYSRSASSAAATVRPEYNTSSTSTTSASSKPSAGSSVGCSGRVGRRRRSSR